MTTPNHRHGSPLLPPDWQDDWPPSLPRPLPPPDPPAGEPADGVAQGIGYEDGNPPPPTPILTPAPTTPNGNADSESQTIIEYEGEEGDTPDADAAAVDDVAQVIADVAQGIAYEQAGRPDAPTEPGDGDAFTQPPQSPATVILIMEPGGNTEPSAGPFTPSGAAPEAVPVFTPSVPATAQTPPQASISLPHLTPPAADVRDDGPARATPRGYRLPPQPVIKPPTVKPRRQRHPFLQRGEARR